MKNLVVFGPPGCGKGTQSANIVKRYELVHLSTGDIIRKEINANSAMGDLLNKFVSHGVLVPDNIILKEVYRFGLDHLNSKGIVFDGFPRNLYQAQMLDRIFHKKSMRIGLVISIDVPEDVLMSRIIERGKTSGRSDDTIEVMKNRLMVYQSQTQPVIDYYKKCNRLVLIDGTKPVDKVFEEIELIINERLYR